jgi:Predicted xylanase/chitin deacetylase
MLCFNYFLSGLFLLISSLSYSQVVIKDQFGAIIRGDTTQKEIAIVFTGDEFADGGKIIRTTLSKHKIKGSFFFTGNFYANRSFRKLISELKEDGHYLGPHSDKHLLYVDWTKRDSLLVSEKNFTTDLINNYEKMAAFGITKENAPYFLPPFEWYNKTIVDWTTSLNLQLINFSPGTRSTADYTYPEMGKSYLNSSEIYRSILQKESSNRNGLNGFILLIHIGTDPKRKDKFYAKLDSLLTELKGKGYRFVRVDELLANKK